MSLMFQLFNDRPLAAAFGLVGLFLLSAWPLLGNRIAILAAQFGIGAAFVTHYLLLEAWTGVAITAVGAAQSFLALAANDHPVIRRLAWSLLPLPALIAWVTWTGVPTLFATTALTLMMIGRMQRSETRLRLVLLAATPFGMVHDAMIGSLPAFAGGGIALILGAFVLVQRAMHASWPKSPRPVRLAPAVHAPRWLHRAHHQL